MDGEKVYRNLSGENEWRERDGIRGEGDLEEEFWKEKGEGGDREKEGQGRVWSCRVVRGRREGEKGDSTERASVRDCQVSEREESWRAGPAPRPYF